MSQTFRLYIRDASDNQLLHITPTDDGGSSGDNDIDPSKLNDFGITTAGQGDPDQSTSFQNEIDRIVLRDGQGTAWNEDFTTDPFNNSDIDLIKNSSTNASANLSWDSSTLLQTTLDWSADGNADTTVYSVNEVFDSDSFQRLLVDFSTTGFALGSLSGQRAISFTLSKNYDPNDSYGAYLLQLIQDTINSDYLLRLVRKNPNSSDRTVYSQTFTKDAPEITDAAQIEWRMSDDLPPTADFTASSYMVQTNETIDFQAQASDLDGSITSYSWDYDDTNSGSGSTDSHSYDDNGSYDVTLTVEDDTGNTNQRTRTISVENQPPSVDFSIDKNYIVEDEIVTFNNTTSDPDGTIAGHNWNFSNGRYSEIWSPTHSFDSSGSYTVDLTAADDDGASDTQQKNIDVSDHSLPEPDFDMSPKHIAVGDTVTFTDQSTYSSGTIDNYEWDFDNGNTAAGSSVNETFSSGGTYNITLTIVFGNNLRMSITKTLHVLSLSDQQPLTGETVEFNDASSDPDGSIDTREWTFYDGGSTTTKTGSTVTYSFNNDGSQDVELTVADNDGSTDTTTKTVDVQPRPPVCSFSVTNRVVYEGGTIDFSASVNAPDSSIDNYNWTFGDGQSDSGSSASSTSNTYSSAGTYEVELQVTDSNSNTHTSRETVKVIQQSPSVSIDQTSPTIDTGETLTLTTTASDPDGSINSYEWFYLEDTYSGNSIDVSFSDDGVYTVGVTAVDSDGATAMDTVDITVNNRPPTCNFTANQTSGDTATDFEFTASASDPDGTIVDYHWDFGDTETGSGPTAIHNYDDGGVYTVELTVTDDDGATDQYAMNITVNNRSPVADFTYSPSDPVGEETIQFTDASSDPDGNISSYEWDFGDGTPTSTTKDPLHAYSDDGPYTVTLTVQDDDGATGSVSKDITVDNAQPNADFDWSPTNPNAVLDSVSFNDLSTDPDGSVVDWEWNIEDGPTITGEDSPDYTFDNSGSHDVTLTVWDDDGGADSVTKTVAVDPAPPTADFKIDSTPSKTHETITFTDKSNDPDGSIKNRNWDFGDTNGDSGAVVSHSYDDDDTYNVTLTVEDYDGLTDSVTKNVEITNRSPVADFTYTPTAPLTTDTVTFEPNSFDVDGDIVQWDWNLGDGTNITNTAADPVDHSYNDDDDYTVSLTVTDDDGATDYIEKTITVENVGPNVDFDWSPDPAAIGEEVQFNNKTNDPDGTVQEYHWSFDNGETSDLENPKHTFFTGGEYEVRLVATDDDGKQNSVTKTIHPSGILEQIPVHACYHIVNKRVSFFPDTKVKTEEIHEVGYEFHADARYKISRHLDNVELHAQTVISIGGSQQFHANISAGINTVPEAVKSVEKAANRAGGVLEETDRKLVEINGESYIQVAEIKDFNSMEFLLDEIDNIDMTVRTGEDFRIPTDRELRLSLYEGSSTRRVIMYEKARENLPPDINMRSET